MNIQTLSIVVPTKGCVNKCKFCVSRMHCSPYEDHFDEIQIQKRIKWAIMNGVNTCIITGTGEALQNEKFLNGLASIFKTMDHPFPNVELQTTGVLLQNKIVDDKLIGGEFYPNIAILKYLRVNTISVSVSDLWDDVNMEVIGVSEKLQFKLADLCKFIKDNGFNLRLSLNMLRLYDHISPDAILRKCKEYGANQVTFRKMYYAEDEMTSVGQWTKINRCKDETIASIKNYIQGYFDSIVHKHFYNGHGNFLYTLPFGGKVYSIDGMSVVMDDDCMSKENNTALKYVILRENGKLYAQWDDEGSLIF